ncbi:MAG: protein-L-isoaspartate(D-aspartate) O-methyltransferase [Pseudomonadales bacterium]
MQLCDPVDLRREMVEHQIKARGVRSTLVLEAMRKVPREEFIPKALREFAYDDTPLPIDGDQTIPQPYIVAVMIDALALEGGENVLEIGAGSGYAAAVLAEIAGQVYTLETIAQLAQQSAAALDTLGYHNIHVLHADGALGWPEHAPYDAILVSAGGPEVPLELRDQLKLGGRLIMPLGTNPRAEELVRVTRLSESRFLTEDIADVRFVPLLAEEGTTKDSARRVTAPAPVQHEGDYDAKLSRAIAAACEPIDSIYSVDLDPLLDRIGNARVVLLGEASHGTSEFYKMRDRISRELIINKNFRFVAIEGDWPDAAHIDHYVRHFEYPPSEWTAFARFPVWMWRNNQFRCFVDWLRAYNADTIPKLRVALHGLDLYSLYSSVRSVLQYLEEVDPHTAQLARARYSCLTPWQSDPASYGRAALTGAYRSCENEVVSMQVDMMRRRQMYAEHDGERFLDAMQNAKLVANAERYYRTMYYGSRTAWNLRDSYMFDTLKTLLQYHGMHSKVIVWAHNSHIGDAAHTEMSARGEHNIGQLCRQEFGERAYSIGFGTHDGTVAAASDWDGPMEIKTIRPSLEQSYERLCHSTGVAQFLLPMGRHLAPELQSGLSQARLERAIGVIYRPETELASHYFQASLPAQFDEFIWFDKTRAVSPLQSKMLAGLPDTYPFGV